MGFITSKEYEEHEKKSKKLEEELEKIDLTNKQTLIQIVMFHNPHGDLLSLPSEEEVEELKDMDGIPIEKNPYVDGIVQLLELGLKARGFDLTRYEAHTIEFYTGCQAEKLVDNWDDDYPRKIISTFNRYSWLYNLKPKGEVLKEVLKDETK